MCRLWSGYRRTPICMKYERGWNGAIHLMIGDRILMLHQGGQQRDCRPDLVCVWPVAKRALVFSLGEVVFMMAPTFVAGVEDSDVAGILAATVTGMKICAAVNMRQGALRHQEGKTIEAQQCKCMAVLLQDRIWCPEYRSAVHVIKVMVVVEYDC